MNRSASILRPSSSVTDAMIAVCRAKLDVDDLAFGAR